jgi:hypothetical protein
VTEIPSAGGGVLTPLFGGAVVVPPPPPPHPHSETTASITKTLFMVKRLPTHLVSEETLPKRA